MAQINPVCLNPPPSVIACPCPNTTSTQTLAASIAPPSCCLLYLTVMPTTSYHLLRFAIPPSQCRTNLLLLLKCRRWSSTPHQSPPPQRRLFCLTMKCAASDHRHGAASSPSVSSFATGNPSSSQIPRMPPKDRGTPHETNGSAPPHRCSERQANSLTSVPVHPLFPSPPYHQQIHCRPDRPFMQQPPSSSTPTDPPAMSREVHFLNKLVGIWGFIAVHNIHVE
ncbi:hypothetical protein E2562_036700, partial [Oryza meyeriana var. granulata]